MSTSHKTVLASKADERIKGVGRRCLRQDGPEREEGGGGWKVADHACIETSSCIFWERTIRPAHVLDYLSST
eukprot:199649-Chlamydomonas_euryale.AAC.1